MGEEICLNCLYDREVVSYNINGKCDKCGSTTFIKKELELSQDDWNLIDEAICLAMAQMTMKDIRGDLPPTAKVKLERYRELRKALP